MAKKKFHIKKNDKVMVIAGKDKGKIGTVLEMIAKKDRAKVEKLNLVKRQLNLVKRHTKPGGKAAQGGIIEKEASIHVSNLMLICGKCAEATRMGVKMLEDGSKVRVCKKCGELLDK
jgi:large subunit ribosomal protein L24